MIFMVGLTLIVRYCEPNDGRTRNRSMLWTSGSIPGLWYCALICTTES